MHYPPISNLPARDPILPTNEIQHFVLRPRSKTRDVAVESNHEWNDRKNIGKEQMTRRIPEEERSHQHPQRPEERDGHERGEVTKLELEDPEPVRRLERVLKDLLRERIVEVVEGEVEQPEHLLRLPVRVRFHKVGRRIARVHRIRYKAQVLALLARPLPLLDVRRNVREDEFRSLPAASCGTVVGSEMAVQELFNGRCGTAGAGAEVHIGVFSDSVATEDIDEEVGDPLRRRGNLDDGKADLPVDGQT